MKKNRFKSCDQGVAAIEFALLWPFFLVLLFSIIEISYVQFIQGSTDTAIQDVTRRVRLHDYQGCDATKEECLKDTFCDFLKGAGDCQANLAIGVNSYADFDALAGDAGATCPSDDSVLLNEDGGDMVSISICYRYRSFSPLMMFNSLNVFNVRSENGLVVIRSNTIFKKEPV